MFITEFEEGKAVRVFRDSSARPDIRMEINEFSRLIIGTCDVPALVYMDNVKVNREALRIGQVFYKKPNMIMEYF